MADKDFVVKNGLVVNSNLIVANAGKVGILTSAPDAILTINGTANVSGNAAFSQRLAVTGAAVLSNTLTLTGNATFSNTVSVVGAVVLSNSVTIAGLVNSSSLSTNSATITNLTVINAPTFTTLNAGNATFTNTVNMNGANTNVTGTLTVPNANVTGRIYVGNSTSYATINSSGAGYFTGDLRVIGSLIVSGNTVSSGTTEQAGDFVPTINDLKLGNNTNRWSLVATDINVTGNLTPFANGGAVGNTTQRWNVWANSIDVSNTSTFTGPMTVTTNSFIVKANSTYNVLAAVGNTTYANVTLQSTDFNVSANVVMTGANLAVGGSNTNITSNVSVAGTNTVFSSNVTMQGANVRITGANLSITSNAVITGSLTVAQPTVLGNLAVVNMTLTGQYGTIIANTQAYKANSTVTNISISGNGSVSNVSVGGDLLTVNAVSSFNNTFTVTSNTQALKSNSTFNVVSIFSNGSVTNTEIDGTNLFVDTVNTTIRGTNTYIVSNTTIDGIVRVNANTTIVGSNVALISNVVVTGTNMNVSSNATFTGSVVANTMSAVSGGISTLTANSISAAANISVVGSGKVVITSEPYIYIGNSTVNSSLNQTWLTLLRPDGWAAANTTGFFVGMTSIANGVITVGSTTMNLTHYTGNVFWANVSGRPTAVSSFTNDLGYANATNLNNINGNANNTNFVGVTPQSSVVNSVTLASNLALYALKSGTTFTGDVTLAAGVQFIANGSAGTADQLLATNGTGVYWKTQSGTVSSVGSGNGLTGGPITGTGTLSVVAGSGIVSNSTGVHVNPAYIATINANNASYLGGALASAYSNSTSNFAYSGNQVFNGTNNYFSSKIMVGASVTMNTTGLTVGSSDINTTNITVGAVVINTTSIAVSGLKYGNNATGNRYVSTVGASGGAAGDIWLQYL